MSTDTARRRFMPMRSSGTEHQIERTYRESATYQWVRETYKNAEEAGATRIEFGIEWQAVENLGVYRRVIADNGKGMTSEELVAFFNTFGGGGKPIGGMHENFGLGAKTSLLPWNQSGVVVVSWVEGAASMIWVQRDAETGEYGLRVEQVFDDDGSDSLDEAYAPYPDPESGCDWQAVKPHWIKSHGTVIVLLGNDDASDTVLGDPTRAEGDIKGISSYLNRRFWEIPDEIEVYVDELRTQERNQWPGSDEIAHGAQPKTGADRRTNHRRIRGAKHYIEYTRESFEAGALEACNTYRLRDGTEIEWFLWKGDRPRIHMYAAKSGFIAAKYENELYDVSSHHSTFRSFGVTEQDVRDRLWLVVKPPMAGSSDGPLGVYPDTRRNSLLVLGGIDAGAPLPFSDWAQEFAGNMPDEIIEAIQQARAQGQGTITDDSWRERLAERFGARWKIDKLRAHQGGSQSLTPTQSGTDSSTTRKKKTKGKIHRGGEGGTSGKENIGSVAGPKQATLTRVAGGLPIYRPVRANELGEGMLAAWNPNDPMEPAGVVLINREHPVLVNAIAHWQSQYPEHLSDQISEEVVRVYGEMAVAKIAHSEYLKGIIPSKEVDEHLRSDFAMTMSLLGLVGEEAVLAPRIGGKFQKARATS